MTDEKPDMPPTSADGEYVGSISNYYGGLTILEWDGRFWWAIENYHGCDWAEIPEALFRTLAAYESERRSKAAS